MLSYASGYLPVLSEEEIGSAFLMAEGFPMLSKSGFQYRNKYSSQNILYADCPDGRVSGFI